MYYFLAILPVLLVLISLIVYIISYYNDIYNFMPKGAECFSRFKGSPISSIHFKKYLNSMFLYFVTMRADRRRWHTMTIVMGAVWGESRRYEVGYRMDNRCPHWFYLIP